MGRVIEAFAQFLDGAGDPLENGWLKFLESGSNNTLKTTYADSLFQVPNTNPVQLDAQGRCPDVFGTGNYRAISYAQNIEDESDVGEQIQMFDPVSVSASGSGGGGSGLVEWDNTATYNIGDIVTYSNLIYRSIVAGNLNKNPAVETSSWEEIAFVQIWNPNVSYTVGDFVEYDGNFYFGLLGSNLNNIPAEDNEYWSRTAQEIVGVDEKTDDYEILSGDRGKLLVLAAATATNKAFSLPIMSATMDGFIMSFFNASAYDLTIDTLDAAEIAGETSFTIPNGVFMSVYYYHSETEWVVTGGNVGELLRGQNLGSASDPIDNIYQGEDAYHYFGNSQEGSIRYNVAGLIIRSDTGLYLGTTDVSGVYFGTNNVNRWYISSAGHLLPLIANTYDIGSGTYELRNIYQAGGGFHYFGDGQEVSALFDRGSFELKPATNDVNELLFGLTGQGWTNIYYYAVDAHLFYINGSQVWSINSSGHLIPTANYDIGSTSAEIGSIYMGTSEVLAFGDAQEAGIWFASGGQLYVRNTDNVGLYLDQMNAAGSIFFRTGSSPTTRWKIDEDGHLVIGSVGAYNIGSPTQEIGHIYLASDRSIYFGSSQYSAMFTGSSGTSVVIAPTQSAVSIGLNLGSSTYEWGQVYVYADQMVLDISTNMFCANWYSNVISTTKKALYVSSSGQIGVAS